MKAYIRTFALFAALMSLFTISCRDDNDRNPGVEANHLLYGDGSKTWKIRKEFDASGDRDKVTKTEKEEVINFHGDNTFSIVDAQGTAKGRWTYDGGSTLTLHFDGDTVTESFSVVKMKDRKLRLKAADGSEMVLVENE
jgi:hypothetical protein